MLNDEIDNEVGAPKEPTICRDCKWMIGSLSSQAYCNHPTVARKFIVQNWVTGAGKYERAHPKDIVEYPKEYIDDEFDLDEAKKYKLGWRSTFDKINKLTEVPYPPCYLINTNGQCELYEESKKELSKSSLSVEHPPQYNWRNFWGLLS